MIGRAAAIALSLALGRGLPAYAQTPSPVPGVTVSGGYAGFIDEGLIDHGTLGAGAEWVLTRHVAVGPEVIYAIGPGSDRDLFVLGVVRAGVLPYSRPVVPFVTAGAGLMRNSMSFRGSSFSSSEGAFVFGGGVRLRLSSRAFGAPEFVFGWEPHVRVGVTAGFTLR